MQVYDRPSYRIVVVHSPTSLRLLKEIRTSLEAKSDGEVIRRALLYYADSKITLPPDVEDRKTRRKQVLIPGRTRERLLRFAGDMTQSEMVRRLLVAFHPIATARQDEEMLTIAGAGNDNDNDNQAKKNDPAAE